MVRQAAAERLDHRRVGWRGAARPRPGQPAPSAPPPRVAGMTRLGAFALLLVVVALPLTVLPSPHLCWLLVPAFLVGGLGVVALSADRKSTRLNSSHVRISYAVFC